MNSFPASSPARPGAVWACPFGNDPTTEQCRGFYAGFVGGTQAAHTALTTKQQAADGKSYSLVDLSEKLEAGGKPLATNGPLIAKGLAGFAGGIDKLASN